MSIKDFFREIIVPRKEKIIINTKGNKDIQDIIELLDKKIGGGIGHINLDVDDTKESLEINNFRECSKNPMACSVPTLHEGMDRK